MSTYSIPERANLERFECWSYSRSDSRDSRDGTYKKETYKKDAYNYKKYDRHDRRDVALSERSETPHPRDFVNGVFRPYRKEFRLNNPQCSDYESDISDPPERPPR